MATAARMSDADTLAADATVVLTALAWAVEPLTADNLTMVLDWPLSRVSAALDHVENHPQVGGPVALGRTEPGTYTVAARLDQLSGEQLRRLGQVQLYRHPLTAGQAHMLLAALTSTTDPVGCLEQRAADPHAERELKRAGLVEAEDGPHRPRVGQDVLYSCWAQGTVRGGVETMSVVASVWGLRGLFRAESRERLCYA